MTTKPYTSRAELQGRWPEGHHAKRFTTERKGLNLAPYATMYSLTGKKTLRRSTLTLNQWQHKTFTSAENTLVFDSEYCRERSGRPN